VGPRRLELLTFRV